MNNYMKKIIRHAIGQGFTVAIIVAVISLTVSNTNLTQALLSGLSGGIIAAILNGILMYKLSVPKYILDEVSVDIDIDEKIVYHAPANYTGAQDPVSGKLFITDKRLIFKNHRQNKTNLEFSIDLRDINEVQTFKSLNVFENGLAIHTVSNMTFNFIVNKTKHWLFHLSETKTAYHTNYK